MPIQKKFTSKYQVDEALSFYLSRGRLRAAEIIKVEGEKEEVIVSFRSIK